MLCRLLFQETDLAQKSLKQLNLRGFLDNTEDAVGLFVKKIVQYSAPGDAVSTCFLESFSLSRSGGEQKTQERVLLSYLRQVRFRIDFDRFRGD